MNHQAVEQALGKLIRDGGLRDALHDDEGLSMAEVADCLNITVPTAKSRVHRARLVYASGSGCSCPAHHLASRWSLKTDPIPKTTHGGTT